LFGNIALPGDQLEQSFPVKLDARVGFPSGCDVTVSGDPITGQGWVLIDQAENYLREPVVLHIRKG
jgi:hypothetical protein